MESSVAIRCEAQAQLIEELRRISGSPSLSVGVFHHGRIVYTKHFGQLEVDNPQRANDNTVYYLASVSKLVSVCAVARLVQDGVLDWDKPILEYLPEFHRPNDDLGREATLRDLASNRTGLPLANLWWYHKQGKPLLGMDEFVRILADIDTVKPFRSSFYYSPWGFVLIQAVVEKVTGKPFGQLIEELILRPMELEDTTFEIPRKANFAPAHAVRNDGSAATFCMNLLDSKSGVGLSMGAKGSMNNVLRFFNKILSAYNYQKTYDTDTTPDSPFTQLREVFTPHISLSPADPISQAYCLGIYRTLLPGMLSCASLNTPLLGKKLPIFGADAPGMEVFHHTGNMPGYFGSYFLVPETQTGVVCLINATPLMDPTDFAAQCLLGAVLEEDRPANLLGLAKLAVQRQIGWYAKMKEAVEAQKTNIPASLPIEAYAGTYINRVGNFYLVVSPTENGLHLAVQGSATTTYSLLHLGGDKFYRPVDRDYEMLDGRFPYPHAPVFIFKFTVEGERVARLTWHTDLHLKPDVFRRVEPHISGKL